MIILEKTPSQWWDSLLSTVTELYPHGPEDSHIWRRAGGDISVLDLNIPAKASWFSALLRLRQGGGGHKISVSALLQTMKEDFPNNPALREIVSEQPPDEPSLQKTNTVQTNPFPIVRSDSVSREIAFALLTALPMELDAILRHGGPWSKVPDSAESPRTYYTSETDSGLTVVASCALGMGQLNAALVARDVVDRWHPKKIILTGIAGGLGSDIQLGDIVVAEQIVDYELGKVSPTGTTPRWSVYRADPFLLDRLRNFRNSEWLGTVLAKRPDGKPNIIPRVLYDVVLSGNKVIADEKTAGALSSVWKRAAAIEMEGAGIAAALHQTPKTPSFILIKSICDKADSAKDDRWQAYAADVAAAYTVAFVQTATRLEDTAPPPADIKQTIGLEIDSRAFRLAISAAFDMAELKILVSDLNEDWDEIQGSTKSEKITELIKYLKRRNRIVDLIYVVKSERPGLLESYVPSL